MISIDDLKRVAKLKGLRNLGHAEKDYIQDIALLSISKNTKDEIVFKGGTCLYKFYRLNRFSEDIDFTLRKGIDIDDLIKKAISDLTAFGIAAEVRDSRKTMDCIMLTLRTRGPLYMGAPQSFSNIGVDINIRSSISIEPVLTRYSSLYKDVPDFSLLIMQEKEILAENVRAIMTRTKARDVYDMWFLLERGVEFDDALIREKLNYYKETWNPKEFAKALHMKESIWEIELGPFIQALPRFIDVRKAILGKIPA
jgi:hypothetical protein